MYLNKALIIGNLTRDPEKKVLPSGASVVSFSIATNRIWKNREGARQESTDFHNIVVFGPQGDNCALYLKKGSSALIEGRIQTRSWDGPDGTKRYRTEIVADRVQFGVRPSDSSSAGFNNQSNTGSNPAPEMETIEYPEEEINPEDIPF